MITIDYEKLSPRPAPLDYLLFFEAVARSGSFTRAAEELNVSQAAVSKRIKVLEGWLGLALVHRQGRRITLTETGRLLAADTGEALDYLTSCFERLNRTNAGGRLSLGANVAVAQYWLTPRINEYLLGRDAVPVTLTASDKDADLFTLDADALIFYGAAIPAGWDGELLFEELWQPVAAPGKLDDPARAEALPLLDFEKLTPKWVNWGDFITLTGMSGAPEAHRVNLGSYGSTLDAAIRGRGVALGCADVLQFEIDEGRLATLPGNSLVTGRSYFVIWRPGTLSDQTRDLLAKLGITA